MGEGELRGGDVPGPCCHTKGGSIRVGLKDGGKRERYFFYLFFFSLSVGAGAPGEATLELGSSTAIRIGMWHDKSTDK